MPWTTTDVDRFKTGLTDAQKRQWVAIANDALVKCEREHGTDCEAMAIRMANGAVAASEARKAPGCPLLFADVQEWIAFLPRPGTYHHPVWGELDFNPERLNRIVANFQSGVYDQTLPINAEHDSSASGAVGYITDMRIAEDGSIEVKPEWNARGKALLDGDRFRYVSAEWWDEWPEPVSGELIPDVATGLAITTKPFFKTDVLRPLAASEADAMTLQQNEPIRWTGEAEAIQLSEDDPKQPAPAPEPASEPEPEPQPEEAPMPEKQEEPEEETTAQGGPVTLNEQALQEFRQMRESVKQLTEQVNKLTHENADLLEARLKKEFTDEVRGHSDDNHIAWYGGIDKHVPVLMRMAKDWGHDSPELKDYIESQRAIAASMSQSQLFREFGIGRGGETGGAYDQIANLARERMKQTGETFEKAFDTILASEDKLRAAYARER